MAAALSPPPILSVRGTIAALRVPTAADLVFSAKTVLAVSLSLLIGFSQNLENPYWSALTVYVLVGQPEAGAIRSKAIFRLIGTVLGGAGAIVLGMVFADAVGALLIATIIAVLISYYPKTIDRTPAGYIWFATPLTLAVVGIAQAPMPDTIFMVAMTRTAEICLAILIVGIVDSVIAPRATLPAFLRTMTDWRAQAGDWAAAALRCDSMDHAEAQRQAERLAQRQALHRITALLPRLDALGVQLPYDIVPVPPRRRDMRLVRMTVAHIVAHLATANVWLSAERQTRFDTLGFAAITADIRAWIAQSLALDDPAILAHAAQGQALADRLTAIDAAVIVTDGHPQDADALLQATALIQLAHLVRQWSALEQMLHAIATGTALPPSLQGAAQRARPRRSADWLLGLIDIAPLALALGFCAALWYFTTWTASIPAMLFVFIALGFIIGTPGAVNAAKGVIVWITVACALTLLYQFVILPQVTAFPVLLVVLAIGIFPLGLLANMSPAGVLILANGFAFLGLQSAYSADFGATLELLLGSLTGCLIAFAALYLCQFSRSRFQARRLIDAARQDLVDIGQGRRRMSYEGLLSLSVDRMALYFAMADTVAPDDPLYHHDLVDLFRISSNLLRLRQHERALPALGAALAALRLAFAIEYRKGHDPDREWLRSGLAATCRAVLAAPGSAPRSEVIAALIGLRLSLDATSQGDLA